jgi:alcohol dehydrogenase class IV
VKNELSNYFFPAGNNGFDFTLRTKIIFGEGTVSRLPGEIKQLSGSKVLIVTSNGMPERPSVKEIFSCLNKAGMNYAIYSSAPPEPSADDVSKCRTFADKISPDCVVGLGGGSVLDVAKKVATEIKLPKIMIPTTAGSGSEVTYNSVIKVDGRKKSFSDPSIAADIAIVDPNLLTTLPATGMVSSALDAMSHAVESYGSRKANPIVRALALDAYLLIKGNIDRALSGDAEGRRNIAMGSLMAGMALANTGTTLGHALANPLSNQGMPHGQALALILPYLLELNRFDAGYADTLKSFRRRYCVIPGIPWNIPEMAKEVAADERHLANNAREVTLQEIAEIYTRIRNEID